MAPVPQATTPTHERGEPARPRTAADAHPITRAILGRIHAQITASAAALGSGAGDPPYARIRGVAERTLGRIAPLLASGEVRPDAPVRLSAGQPAPTPVDRAVRLGVYPVQGNPLHWGHLLCALAAVGDLRLDRVAFVVQGIDARKRWASARTQRDRHTLASRVLDLLDPLAAYSAIGRGNRELGEDNVFRLLRLNAGQRLVAYYLVGGDHYRRADVDGEPDTLARLERNAADPRLAFDAERHELRVAFLARGRRGPRVPTTLPVTFVPEVLEASSSTVRQGGLSLAPYETLRYLSDHPAYAASFRGSYPTPGAGTLAP